jgi:hypothetical protein
VARQVLNSIVFLLAGGAGVSSAVYAPIISGDAADEEEQQWLDKGKKAFAGDEGREKVKEVVEGVLQADGGTGTLPGWCEEQVSARCSMITSTSSSTSVNALILVIQLPPPIPFAILHFLYSHSPYFSSPTFHRPQTDLDAPPHPRSDPRRRGRVARSRQGVNGYTVGEYC